MDLTAMTPKPYTKTLQDELDWKLLDQLHGAVAQISSYCFETKKFCVTTEFIVLTIVVKLTKDSLDHSVFVAAMVIPIAFWFLDATGYFYQVKLRCAMESIRQRLASREGLVTTDGSQVISPLRGAAPARKRVIYAAFNHSMWLYAILLAADISVWCAFSKGWIQ